MSEFGKDVFVRVIWRYAAVMALLLVVVGCSAGANSESTPTAIPTAAGLVLEPPEFVMKAKAGEQSALPGTFFWVAPNGMVADIKVEGVPVMNAKTLTVGAKEKVTISIRNGAPPQTLEMRLYPKDGNFKPAPIAGASADTFLPATEPIWSRQEKPDQEYSVTIDAPKPGDYYLWLKGTWPNSWLPDKPSTGEKAFVLQVK